MESKDNNKTRVELEKSTKEILDDRNVLCDRSDEKEYEANITINDLTAGDRERSAAELTNLQKTKLSERRAIPQKLCKPWADSLTDIAFETDDAARKIEAL